MNRKTNIPSYLLIQIILMFVSPICSFLLSIRFFRNPISQVFFVIFAFYFGYFFPLDWDLNNHYVDFLDYYGHSLSEVLALGNTYYLGNEPYHIILKYLISRFTDSSHIFGGVACAVYSISFLFFFRQLSVFYKKRLHILNYVLLAAVTLVIEFRWFQGVRFCTGTFVFFGFYMKYLNTNKLKYLALSSVCVLFHYALFFFVFAIGVNWLFTKVSMSWRYLFLIASFMSIIFEFDIVDFLINYTPMTFWFKVSLLDSSIRAHDMATIATYREVQNVYYAARSPLAIMVGVTLLYIFHKNNALSLGKHYELYLMFLTLFSISNFDYLNFTAYTRFLKNTVLVLYIFLFICSVENYEKLRRNAFVIALLALIPAIYLGLTVLVEQRAELYNLNLIFGNFFRQGPLKIINF